MEDDAIKIVCNQIENTILELDKLDSRITSTQSHYLRAGFNTVKIILCATASVLDGRNRPMKFNTHINYQNHLAMMHRIFTILIHTTLESALDYTITQKNDILESSMKTEINNEIKKLIDESSCTDREKLKAAKNLRGKANKIMPNFNDKILHVTKTLGVNKAKIWRQYFTCLTIIRNKCSHSDCKLNEDEIKKIKSSMFSPFLSDKNELKMKLEFYAQTCEHILTFLDEISK